MRTSYFDTFLCCWFLVSSLSLQLGPTDKSSLVGEKSHVLSTS